jgi:predicted DNA-binding WGR domain protein
MGRMPLPPFTQQDTTTGKPLKYTDSYKETRWFVFKKGKSHKFWTIRMAGPKQAVTFGRVGQEGQTKIKIYTTPNRQMAASGKLIEKKLAKGYIEIGRRMGIDPKEMSDPKHQAEHSAMPHEEPRHARQSEAEASRQPATSTKFETRYYELADGKSKKFWSIKRSTGNRSTRYTVNWGRIGTEGQTKTFTLPTASAMVKSADKLIAQKIAKGYAAVDRR